MSKQTEINQAQIDAWKKQHKSVFGIEVEDKQGYVRVPTRQELGTAQAASKGNNMNYLSILLKKIWLGGDTEILTDDRLFLGVVQELDVVIETADAKVKKL